MVWNYQNADCSLKKIIYCVVYYNFRHSVVPRVPDTLWLLPPILAVVFPVKRVSTPPDMGAEYCDERVCLSVCVFVCPRSYLRNYTSDLHQKFCACCLWLWLGPPLAAQWYVMYFRFFGWRHICSQAKVVRRRCPAEAQCTRNLGLGYKLCAVIPVAGQRTQGTAFGRLRWLPRWQHCLVL